MASGEITVDVHVVTLGELAEIKRGAGEHFVLTCDRPLSDEQTARIMSMVLEHLPSGSKLLVLSDNFRLSVAKDDA